MKKVAIIAPNALPVPPVRGGGVENGIWEILPYFNKYPVHVLSVYDPALDNLLAFEQVGDHFIYRFHQTDLQKAWLRVRHLSFNFHFPYAWVTAQKLNEIQPEIVHIRSRLWLLPYYRKLLTYTPKYVLTHHNHYFCEMPPWQVRHYMEMVDAFVGVSHFSSRIEVLDRFPAYEHKTFEIYNGCNITQFRPNPSTRESFRQQYGLPAASTVMLFVGRLTSGKGIDVAINAFNAVAAKYPEAYLVIVGSSWFATNEQTPYTQKLVKLSLPYKDRIVFTGYIGRDHIADIFAAADIFVGPSRMEEPFGQVFTEAMACGLPVLSTRQGGIPEIVRHGIDGFLMEDKENAAQLAQYLDRLLADESLRLRMSRDASHRVHTTFTWEQAALRTEKLYAYLLGET